MARTSGNGREPGTIRGRHYQAYELGPGGPAGSLFQRGRKPRQVRHFSRLLTEVLQGTDVVSASTPEPPVYQALHSVESGLQ